MIGWLQPAALWGLLLAAMPIVIHLLRTRPGPRMLFPTLRFVPRAAAASVRPGTPSDLPLLIVRVGIVTSAVLAAAAPLVLFQSRVDAWNARRARAIVADASRSMGEAADASSSRAGELARAEFSEADFAFRADTDRLDEGLRRAVAWLSTAPPARQEIVIVSDFQHGALSPRDLEIVPANVGLRFVPYASQPKKREILGEPLLGASNVSGRLIRSEISPEGTRSTVIEGTAPDAARFRLITAADRSELDSLLRSVARAGAPAPAADEPIAVRFAPAPPLQGRVSPLTERWMLATSLRVERDTELARIARGVRASNVDASGSWIVLVRDDQDAPLVRAAALDDELIVDVAAPATTYFAAAVIRSVLHARVNHMERGEDEVLSVPAATLSAWSRPAEPIGIQAWRKAEYSDARWLWAAALVLLAIEGRLRRRQPSAARHDRVAA